jgi:hypothetical protein
MPKIPFRRSTRRPNANTPVLRSLATLNSHRETVAEARTDSFLRRLATHDEAGFAATLLSSVGGGAASLFTWLEMGAAVGGPVTAATLALASIAPGIGMIARRQGRNPKHTSTVTEEELRPTLTAYWRGAPLDRAVIHALVKEELGHYSVTFDRSGEAAIGALKENAAELPDETKALGTKIYWTLRRFQPKTFTNSEAAEEFAKSFRSLPDEVQAELRPAMYPQVFKGGKPRVKLEQAAAAELFELLRPRETLESRLEALTNEFDQYVSKRSMLGKMIDVSEAKALVERIREFPEDERPRARQAIIGRLYTSESLTRQTVVRVNYPRSGELMELRDLTLKHEIPGKDVRELLEAELSAKPETSPKATEDEFDEGEGPPENPPQAPSADSSGLIH